LLALLQIGAADPRIGSWALTSAQSTMDPPNKISITAVKDGVHVVASGDNHADFTASWNGQAAAVPGNPGFDQIELHKINRRESKIIEMKNGAVVATIHDKLSPNGNELTITTARTSRPDQITVWTRTGGVKAVNDPFAGEWTEDLGKSRMAQATPLKIESDGKGGVRFIGDYSYTARFDGKDYDVKNSPNDTVALQLADPHTVNATFRRDNQTTQKDKWVVSADGKTMTLTSTGTLETGQHVTDQLVYQKQ
jgi:hypothetical protein